LSKKRKKKNVISSASKRVI